MSNNSLVFPKWLVHAFLCIFWWGIFGFLAKLGADKISPYHMQVLFTVGLIPVAALALIKCKGKVQTDKLGATYGLLNGICAGVGCIAYFAAMEEGKASIVGPVTSLFPLLTVMLAVFFLKEKVNTVQKIGIVTGLIAIFILSA